MDKWINVAPEEKDKNRIVCKRISIIVLQVLVLGTAVTL